MAIMKIFWNLVHANANTNISNLTTNNLKGVKSVKVVGGGCNGILFRSVFSQEASFSRFLSEMTLDRFRKTRQESDATLLFRPKGKEEKSIATIRIIRPKQFTRVKIPAVAGSSPSVPVSQERPGLEFDVLLETTEFILEEVQEQMAERFQLQETFGDFNAFFFGKRAEIGTYSGSLFNAKDDLQWRNQFISDYDEIFRATKTAEQKARAYLLYDDVVREGYIPSIALNQNSLTEGVVKFTFTMLITGRRILGRIPKARTVRSEKTVITPTTKDNQFGIEEFQFFRKLDPDLPGVFPSPPIPDLPPGGVQTVSLGVEPPTRGSFVEDTRLPGEEPPGDLKTELQNRSLRALEAFVENPSRGDVAPSGTLDHDILIDFVDIDQISPKLASTRSLISGKAPGEKVQAEVLAQDLVTGRLLFEDLAFGQAVSLLDFLISENPSGINQDTIRRLTEIQAILNKRHKGGSGVSFGENTDFEGAKEAAPPLSFSLPKKILDPLFLERVVNELKPLRDLDVNELVEEVLDNTKTSVLKFGLANEKENSLLQSAILFAAIWTRVPDPSGALFSEVEDIFGSGASGNALDFTLDKPTSSFRSLLPKLTAKVTSATSSVLSNSGILKEDIFDSINEKTGVPKRKIPLTEEIVFEASRAAPPVAGSAAFLQAVSTYVLGIVGSIFRSPNLTSLDSVAGTAREIDFKGGLLPKEYFTQNYFEGQKLNPGRERHLVALRSPHARLKGDYLFVSGGTFNSKDYKIITKAGEVTFTEPPDPVEQLLFRLGIITQSSQAKLQQMKDALKDPSFFLFFLGDPRRIRYNSPYVVPSLTLVSALREFSFSAADIPTGAYPFFFPPTTGGLPVQRSYLNPEAQAHFLFFDREPSAENIEGSVKALLAKLGGNEFKNAMDSARDGLRLLLEKPKEGNNPNTTGNPAFRNAFSLDAFKGAGLVQQIAGILENKLGAPVKDIFGLLVMAEIQREGAKLVQSLQDRLKVAVDQLKKGTPTTDVIDQTNKQNRTSVCKLRA